MEMNQEQVKRVLGYIDQTQPENVKDNIFSQLGHQCFQTRGIRDWVLSYAGNVQAFLDRVNVEQQSPYWERLEFNDEGSILYLTGKQIQKCACAFAEMVDPPVALCTYCCKAFQEDIFSTLLGRPVTVEITASFLLGDDRCSTAIHLQ